MCNACSETGFSFLLNNLARVVRVDFNTLE